MAPTKESRRGHKSFSPRAGEAGGVRLKLDRDGVPIAPFSSGKGSSLNAPIKSHSPHGEDAGAYSSIPFAAVLRTFCHGSELKTPFRGCRAYLQASQTDASDMSRCNEPGETVLQRSGRWGDCVEAKAPLRCRKCKGHARMPCRRGGPQDRTAAFRRTIDRRSLRSSASNDSRHNRSAGHARRIGASHLG